MSDSCLTEIGRHRFLGTTDDLIEAMSLAGEETRRNLAATVVRHAAPGAQVWIVDPDRGNRSAFHRRMADAGVALQETRVGGAASPARMLRYTR